MRFLLLSKADLFGNINLNRLLPGLCPKHEVRVCLSDRIFPDERGFAATDSYMYHTRDFLLDEFFPAVDSAWSGASAGLSTFAGLGKRFGLQITNLGGDVADARARLVSESTDFSPHVILCCRHDFIVPIRAFRIAMRGAYNIHSGALPRYRGPFCTFWAMQNGDRRMGCTIHYLSSRVDTGPIVDIAWIDIDYQAALVDNLLAIYAAGVDAFLAMLPSIEAGEVDGIPQLPGPGAYFRQPDAEDCATFTGSGRRFVDGMRYRKILSRYVPDTVRPDDVSLPTPKVPAL